MGEGGGALLTYRICLVCNIIYINNLTCSKDDVHFCRRWFRVTLAMVLHTSDTSITITTTEGVLQHSITLTRVGYQN